MQFAYKSIVFTNILTAFSLLDLQFDMITLSETKSKDGIGPIFDLSLPGYKHYLTTTESDGGVIIYAKDNIIIKKRDDLEEKNYKSC